MKIKLRNKTGMIKERKVGFSWTTLFSVFSLRCLEGIGSGLLLFFWYRSLRVGRPTLYFASFIIAYILMICCPKAMVSATKKSQSILISKGFIAENYAANFAG